MRKSSAILEDTSEVDDKKELAAARADMEKAKKRLADALLKNPAPSVEDPQEG